MVWVKIWGSTGVNMKLMVFWDVIMGCLVIHTDVLEEPAASIFRVGTYTYYLMSHPR